MKYQVNGVITIPAGLAQVDDLEIDSPIVELQPSTIADAGVTLVVLYTYMQGTVERKLSLNHFIPIEDLNPVELDAVVTVKTLGETRLANMYPGVEPLP